ncbi:restriction endonuclease [Aldersonia kunmingensis]|uniref:restriction endonuclease n=1 Tax=Aldersonia kunmingensis TaxID=408066 RepID=UPI00082A46F2|nr:restriction endonuclease [Aldersonia kunmingensis]
MLLTMSAQVPSYYDLLWPALQTVIELGGSASIEELDAAVIEREGLSPEVQAVLHSGGPSTEVQYRLAWARTYLKGMGLLTNSQRAVWSVTEQGRAATENEMRPLHTAFVNESRKKRAKKQKPAVAAGAQVPEQGADANAESEWKEALLDTLLKMSPAAFERLAQRLLREEGFVNTHVTGRSGDGGIDGQGVYRLSLLSFQVFFQCKRYVGSVGSGAVRDFRGAMAGRGDKGLLITTGTFTSDAQAEATRDGAPPIDLIDGARLCDLLKDNQIGVTTTKRLEVDVAIDAGYFLSLEPKSA